VVQVTFVLKKVKGEFVGYFALSLIMNCDFPPPIRSNIFTLKYYTPENK